MATKTPTTTTQQQGAAAGNKPGLRKPVFVKVDALKPGTNGHTLVVKVVNSNTVLNKKPRNPTFRGPQNQNTRIAECLVGDETGTILFTARNEQGLNISWLSTLCLSFTDKCTNAHELTGMLNESVFLYDIFV